MATFQEILAIFHCVSNRHFGELQCFRKTKTCFVAKQEILTLNRFYITCSQHIRAHVDAARIIF